MKQQLYCLDAGVLINSWTKHYPPELFPSLWEHLSELCRKKVVFVPQAVAEEVAAGDDGVSQWLKERKAVILKPNDDIIFQTKEIINKYRRLVADGGNRSAADPWVIGYAFSKGAVVVTEEQESKTIEKPKIPNVCNDLGVVCTNTVGLLRLTGFKTN